MISQSVRPLRAALLGTGAWANVLAAAARGSTLIHIAGVWGRTPERARAFGATAGIEVCDSLEQVWANEDIEAVVIALPNAHHYPFAKLAASHGKHIFIEKPIAHTLEDGLRTAALERAYPIRIAVGHCARLLPGNRAIGDAIHRGELGPISLIEANFSNDRGLRLAPGDWRWYQAGAPGGPLSQIAIHQFDVLRALGGDLESVSAQCATRSPVGAEVEDQWIVVCKFVDGTLGNVVTSWTSPGAYSVRVTGSRAVMHYEIDQSRWSQAERLHEHAILYKQVPGQSPGARTSLAVSQSNMFRAELEMFADAIRTGQALELSCDNACHALAAVDAARASAAQGGRSVMIADMVAQARARVVDDSHAA